MKVTTGNVLQGVVKAVKTGAVNDEIDIELKGGLNVAAIVTCRSTEKLGLRPVSYTHLTLPTILLV